MSVLSFPVLVGLGWNMKRTPMWGMQSPGTSIQESVSGKETRVARWTYPRWGFELSYAGDGFLLQGTLAGATRSDFANLAGFFNARSGQYDSFLYTDPDDNAVVGQQIGTGDGTTTIFNMVRAFGGFVEPTLAVNLGASITIKLNGTPTAAYNISTWQMFTGNAGAIQGQIRFNSAPGAGVVITADFSYYWPCRFVDDHIDFEKFMTQLYSAGSVKFCSLKN